MIYKLISIFSKIVARIGLCYKREILDAERKMITSLDLEGCLLLTRRKYELANLFIQGNWKHVAMILSNQTIMDMTVKDGLKKRSIFDLIESSSEYKLIRPTFCYSENTLQSADEVYKSVRSEYDHSHNPLNSFYDCSELIWMIFHNDIGVFSPIHSDGFLTPSVFDNMKDFITILIFRESDQ